jgi:Fic family protein
MTYGVFVMSTIDRLELPEPNPRKYVFIARKMFAELVYDTAALEDSPYTFPEVQTLLDGITVGGHKLEDQQLVLNQAQSWKRLLSMVEHGGFAVTKDVFCELHAMVAKEEALTWGEFRDGHVSIAGTVYRPPAPERLDGLFQQAMEDVQASTMSPHQTAFSFFLQGAANQYFWDGNKRTSRLMMNGILLSHGYPVVSVPAKLRLEFNQTMVRFYDSYLSGNPDNGPMLDFLSVCAVHSSPDIRLRGEMDRGPSRS